MMQAVKTTVPPSGPILMALLRADIIVQVRRRTSILMSLIIPLFFLFAWRDLIPRIGSANVLAACISVGLPSLGLMGYALVLARDRELGVFQRLRTTPCTTWMFMASRYIVQLSIMAAMTIVTMVASLYVDNIHIAAGGAIRALIASILSGLMFLALGQLVAALFVGSETVTSATRMVYIAVLVAGILAQTLPGNSPWRGVMIWSPVGVSKAMIAGAFSPGFLSLQTLTAIFAAICYTIVFAAIGIQRFRWSTER